MPLLIFMIWLFFGLSCFVTVALVVLGREVESGSVFAVTRSSTAVTPHLINYNIVVALGVSVAPNVVFTAFSMSLNSSVR